MYNLNIDRRKKVDVPTQLVDSIKEYISTKQQFVDNRMWAIDEFADHYEISMDQAEWVYKQLLESNLIHQDKNAYFIEDFEIPVISFNKMNSIKDLISLNNMEASFKDLKQEIVSCPEELQEMKLDTNQRFLRIERLYYGNEKPLIYTVHYYDLNQFKDLDKFYQKNTEISDLLFKHYVANKDSSKLRFKGKMLSKAEMQLFDTQNPLSNYLESFIYQKDHSLYEYTQICILADTLRYRIDFDL